MLFKKVQATYVGDEEFGYFSVEQPGLLIAKDVFMYADGNDLKVERFKPLGSLILIGEGMSELLDAQQIFECFSALKKDDYCCNSRRPK
ncbi:hypothetical protein AB685_00405 [Bacillus sp. LL01]|uniref:hypothetical protein n=1 Tax=Bacillus sp. LL01 TaxID=1665556 RepID=UPI00064D7106|nr:hypothetical protein [Bacillus sp. LL01]KMJ59388.1 hypothetical protein AB685_00405 [Bacillus sp. LL01]